MLAFYPEGTFGKIRHILGAIKKKVAQTLKLQGVW
ncbi:hypothetical protein GLO73106DRAFT_00006630 [Gloeocapsa sp. PCC 73106]|nr:hypothetical protein GLO73106DRAFT_00006630 [Gloeocapsa sp. PCC 73106]